MEFLLDYSIWFHKTMVYFCGLAGGAIYYFYFSPEGDDVLNKHKRFAIILVCFLLFSLLIALLDYKYDIPYI